MEKTGERRLHVALLASVALVFVWSAVGPRDRLTWFLEVLPAVIGVAVLALVYPRFRLTPLAYVLISAHAVVLMVGGHYTYAEVPLFDWIRDTFGLARNHYDRLGHLMQGASPAIVAREVLLRRSPIKHGGWLFFMTVAVCLSISAFYELIEWWAALVSEEAAQAFLGTQGDPWDTQWDMFLALVGAVASLTLLGGLHDRQLEGARDDR